MSELIQKKAPGELQDALRASGDLSIAPIVMKSMIEDLFKAVKKKIKDMEKGLQIERARVRKIKKGNSGLPKEAVKCTDKIINKLLQETWVKEIKFYNDTKRCIRPVLDRVYKFEESSFESQLFAKQLHPVVEGYDWYRGFSIDVNGGKVLIFSGWMQPWYTGGAPDPIVYVLGGVCREDILKAVQAYCQGIERQIVNQ